MSHVLPEDWIILPDLAELREGMGGRLLKLRLDRGWKQVDVAERLGITAFRMSAYEYGDNSVPYDVLDGLCDLYEVTADYLIGRTEEADSNVEEEQPGGQASAPEPRQEDRSAGETN